MMVLNKVNVIKLLYLLEHIFNMQSNKYMNIS